MLTIITPCSRPENIPALYESIQFDKIYKWVIVYDTSKGRTYTKLYEGNPKILEVECEGGISGNPQRNFGMTLVSDGFLYFLDDDNIFHPGFWSILEEAVPEFFYTFDQIFSSGTVRFRGNNIRVNAIDTAMYLIHKQQVRDIQWHTERYNADGYFIEDIMKQNKECHKYIPRVGCYYNFLKKTKQVTLRASIGNIKGNIRKRKG